MVIEGLPSCIFHLGMGEGREGGRERGREGGEEEEEEGRRGEGLLTFVSFEICGEREGRRGC